MTPKVFAAGDGPLAVSNILEASIELKDPNLATFNNRCYVDETMGDICERVQTGHFEGNYPAF